MFHSKSFLTAVCFCSMLAGIACPVQAADNSKSRDVSVDNLMVKNQGWMGVLPATAGEAAVDAKLAGPGNFVNTTFPPARNLSGLVTADRSDKRARVYDIKGSVKMAKKGSQDWKEVKKDARIEEGFIVLTGKESYASVTFDLNYLNAVHIPENTRAYFRSIEPTDVVLEDGTIYNFLDGLSSNESWKVSTPVAVAAVRGTHYLVSFTSASGEFIEATINVPDDGHESSVEVISVKDGKEGSSADIPEGYQIDLTEGETPDAATLEKIDPKWLQQIEDVLKKLAELRKIGEPLPPTAGEFVEPGVLDPAGPDTVSGNSDNNLDPQDTALTPDEPSSSSSEEEFREEQPAGEGEGEGEGNGEGEGEIDPEPSPSPSGSPEVFNFNQEG